MSGRAAIVLSLVAGALLAGCSSGAGQPAEDQSAGEQPVPVELVRVGDAGNRSDFTGYGSVDHGFSLGKHEVTVGQYVEFLNAVAAEDPHDLYSPAMAADPNVNGIARSGAAGSYTYAAMANDGSSANRPVTFVSWFDAARFANWYANGRPSGKAGATTTEDGAYPLHGAVAGKAPRVNAVNANTGKAPQYRLPTEDEWYKAAYYSPDIAPHGGIRTPPRNAINPNTKKAPSYYLPTASQWYKAAYYDPGHDDGY